MLTSPTVTAPAPWCWDVFCRVIDNFGDLGVCWRLCADLAQRGHAVRLWVDDTSALQWMAPGALDGKWSGVSIFPWSDACDPKKLASLPTADVWVEGFGCEIAPEFIAAPALSTASKAEMTVPPPVWINLEYLSAERYVERAHALPSPVFHGAGIGRTKHFFYPGFTLRTGGLLREPGLMDARALFEDSEVKRTWLASQGIAWRGERLVSLFCYEPVYLAPLLALWAAQTTPIRLLVTPGRTRAAVEAACALRAGTVLPGALQIHYLEALSQADFDRLLWCCDVNFVRGEDSLVRAIWAGKPLIWHIYPQDDGAHHTKLEAFLQTLDAPTDLAEFHRFWNANAADTADNSAFALGELWPRDLRPWQQTAMQFRQRLLEMDDLATQLIRFVQKKR